jgi:hypothetical protein
VAQLDGSLWSNGTEKSGKNHQKTVSSSENFLQCHKEGFSSHCWAKWLMATGNWKHWKRLAVLPSSAQN